MLKQFRIWRRFRGDIRMESSIFLLCGFNGIREKRLGEIEDARIPKYTCI